MSNPSDYTVGWICAISTELVAARAFLDEEQDPPNVISPQDNNIYTLGRIGKHSVVIAALPDGEYGIGAAASVARDMLHSFPNVRIGLMVGIGGGVPGKHDIRLGDVVVSATHDEHGGVFQYDFGKSIQTQEFQNTMFLNQPPAVLRSAVGGLKADYESDGHQFQETINRILMKKPRLRKKYQRPDAGTDRLYLSNVVHPLKSNESCAVACGASRLVPREQRAEDEDDPQIHYGLIASGNKLMKDALIRDELASKKDVLCFEMEAAGLMNHFPCLVIRGICDYSDSHKNKIWQGYAAMTAAAYAKDLITRIPSTKIEAEDRIVDVLSGVKESVDRLVNVYDDQRKAAILDWLTPLDYSTRQSDYLKRRQQGTGEWLLSSDQFQTWVKDDNHMLFCPGMPGAGKTVLTSVVVDHLHSRFQTDSRTGFAYFFFDYKQQDEQTVDALLASFLKQLIASQSSLPEVVQQLHNQHNTQGQRTRPSTEEFIGALKSVAEIYSRIFIMIDALDECKSSNGALSRVLSCIFELRSKTGANFFITSRFNAEISSAFSSISTLEIRASDEDIRRYLSGNMVHLPRFVLNDPSLQEEIIAGILQAVQGMFLVAQFHFDSLKGKTKPKEVTSALQNLATGSDAYEQIYTDTMNRIVSQHKEQTQLARSVLSWLTFSKRPLTVAELQHALGVEPTESGFDERNMPDIEIMVSVCAGLITIENDSRIIRLVHYTTQEYFQRTHEKWFPQAQFKITMICITYLSYVVFHPRAGDDRDAIETRIHSYPFHGYAFRHWGDHAREDNLPRYEVTEFLKDAARIKSYGETLKYIPWRDEDNLARYYLNEKTTCTGLHLATFFGLTATIDLLLYDNTHIEDTNERGETPLHIAALCGHEDIAQLLLKNNAHIDAVSIDGQTPLHIAAERGHSAIVQLLLDNNAYIEAVDRDNKTPLFDAANWGHKPVVQLLLDNSANIEAVDRFGQTSLLIAAAYGAKDVVQLLLDNSANVKACSLDGDTPLHRAAFVGFKAIAQLLLDNGADIEAVNDCGSTPLHDAAQTPHGDVFQVLLDYNANIEAVNDRGTTPLHMVANYGRTARVQMLLDRAVNIEPVDMDGNTPLILSASSSCGDTIVQLLLHKGANVRTTNMEGSTALHNAVSYNNHYTGYSKNIPKVFIPKPLGNRKITIETLLNYGADIEAADKTGNTPLHLAAKSGNEEAAALLLSKGAKVNATDKHGRTPLFKAIAVEHEEDYECNCIERIVQLLLNNGANVQATDNRGHTALDVAAEKKYEAVVELLLRKSAIRAPDEKIEGLENRTRKRVRLNSLGEGGEVTE